jgi:hypothetical protein
LGDTLFVTSGGSSNSSYLVKYDTAGMFINAYSLSATGPDRINAISADSLGNVYIAGEFNGSADFDFSTLPADTFMLSSAGTSTVDPDIFFAKYLNDTLIWARKVGNAESQFLSGMAVGAKTLNIIGRFGGDVIFDPQPPVNQASRLEDGGFYLSTYRTAPPSSEKELITYAFTTPPATGAITAEDSVLLTVPFATNVTGLIADFTVSPDAIAHVGNTLQVSGTTSNDFSTVLTYTIMAEDSSTRDYFVRVTVEPDTTVGIDEYAKENAAFKVWPNPAQDALYFGQASDIKLYDVNGRLLREARKVTSLSVKDLSPGLYIIENEKRQKRKITVN